MKSEVIQSDNGKYHFVRPELARDIIPPQFTLCGKSIRTGYWRKPEDVPERFVEHLKQEGRMCKACLRIVERRGRE